MKAPLWATPDESWTARELIGGDTVDDGEIVFRPGWILRAISEDRWLVLDEANRGDLDRIFGALLTWLSGGSDDVAVGTESAALDAKTITLGWTEGPSRVEVIEGAEGVRGAVRYLASLERWRLLGTYNALDAQRVFRIGAALGRRFVRVPIPPLEPDLFMGVLDSKASYLPQESLDAIAFLYKAHFEEEVTRLGPALFLGMCGYLRVSLPPEPVPDPPPASGVTTGDASEGPRLVHSPASLAEAYVMHAGTQLAQLEQPDFDSLVARIADSTAMPREELEWVGAMIQSLA